MKINKTWILTIISIGGVLSTAWFSSKNTLKYQEIIKEEQPETTEEKFKAFLKSYWQTMAVIGGTCLCIVANQKINMKQLSMLMGAAGVLTQKYKKYREKVIEEIGPEREAEIQAEIAKENWGAFGDGRLPENKNQENVLFYDTYIEKYFWASVDRVKDAMYHLNRNFALGGVVSLAEFYDFIGVDLTGEEETIGWLQQEFWEGGLIPWVDFDACIGEAEDGTKCWIINYIWPPYNLEEKDKELNG